MLYLLFGDNEYAKHACIDELVSEYIKKHGDGGLDRLDGSEVDASTILNLGAQSLFSVARMVVISDLSMNTNSTQLFTEAIERITDTTDVILLERKVKKNTTYYKTLKKHATVQEFSEPNESELTRWVMEFATKNEAKIDASTAQMLVARVGRNQLLLQNEILKLLSYDPHITKQSVELLIEQKPKDNIFELLEFIGKGSPEKARDLYRELRRARTEPHYIMSMIAWQLGNMATVVAYRGKTAQQIASEAGISPYVAQKTLSSTRNLSLKKVAMMLHYATITDTKLKSTSSPPDQLLEQLIDRLALTSE